jgi:hypothetical protein
MSLCQLPRPSRSSRVRVGVGLAAAVAFADPDAFQGDQGPLQQGTKLGQGAGDGVAGAD